MTDELPCNQPYKYDRNEVYPIVDYDHVQTYLEELRVSIIPSKFHEIMINYFIFYS